MKIQFQTVYRTKLPVIVIGGFLAAAVPVIAQTWTKTAAPIKNWSGISCSADGQKWTATADETFSNNQGVLDGIYASTNLGVSWTQTGAPSNDWNSIAGSADGMQLVATSVPGTGSVANPSKAGFFRSFDSGTNWTTNGSPSVNLFVPCSSADGKILAALHINFAVINKDQVWYSTNAGAVWTQADVSNSTWNSVACSADGKKLVAVGTWIFTSTNSGATWISNSVPNNNWWTVAFSADGQRLLAAGNSGRIYISTNSGMAWGLTSAPATNWQSVASSADGSRLLAAVRGGGIYTSTNSGTDWTVADAPNTNWQAVACSADGHRLLAVVYGGGIYTSYSSPAPAVGITVSNNQVACSWIIPSTNFVLQQNLDLVTTNWTDVTNMPVLNLSNLQNQVILPVSNESSFYRLTSP